MLHQLLEVVYRKAESGAYSTRDKDFLHAILGLDLFQASGVFVASFERSAEPSQSSAAPLSPSSVSLPIIHLVLITGVLRCPLITCWHITVRLLFLPVVRHLRVTQG